MCKSHYPWIPASIAMVDVQHSVVKYRSMGTWRRKAVIKSRAMYVWDDHPIRKFYKWQHSRNMIRLWRPLHASCHPDDEGLAWNKKFEMPVWELEKRLFFNDLNRVHP